MLCSQATSLTNQTDAHSTPTPPRGHTMHDQTTTTYMLQHGNHSPQKKTTLTSNIGALRPGKRSQHQKKPALTKVNGAHLIKWLAAFCVLDCVGASEFGESPAASSTCDVPPPTLEDVVIQLQEARQEIQALRHESYQQLQNVRECSG
eukprot:scaffold37182_cov56-Phaeocystis_antarctica.AAC.2